MSLLTADLIQGVIALIGIVIGAIVYGRYQYRQGERRGKRKVIDAIDKHEDKLRQRAEDADANVPDDADAAYDRLRDRRGRQ